MIKLKDYPTKSEGLNKKEIKKEMSLISEKIAQLQHTLYAQGKHSVLIIFQGMDSSGKDGATRKVFKACSPAGIKVHAYKKPTEEEFSHDFLWRIHKNAPAKGEIVIFNRSHYEDILIHRVHGWIDEEHASARIDAINSFETLLQKDNGTHIIKCYMHISEKRQEEKLQERIDLPEKNWKHNSNDWKERKHWKSYINFYEEAINRCNAIPWNIIPCDQRWYRDYCIAKLVLSELQKLDIQLPTVAKKDLVK